MIHQGSSVSFSAYFRCRFSSSGHRAGVVARKNPRISSAMANMLRPWLAPLLQQELDAALRWKQGQLDRTANARVKAEHDDDDDDAMSDLDSDGDLLYSDDGSNLRMSVTREFSSGHNSFLQIVQVRMSSFWGLLTNLTSPSSTRTRRVHRFFYLMGTLLSEQGYWTMLSRGFKLNMICVSRRYLAVSSIRQFFKLLQRHTAYKRKK